MSRILLLGTASLLVLREQRRRIASVDETRVANHELLSSLDESQRLSQSLRQLAELGEMLQGATARMKRPLE